MEDLDVQNQMFNQIIGWQQSGLSQKHFCEQNGIKYHVFHYWDKHFRDSQPVNQAAKFVHFIFSHCKLPTTMQE